MRIILVLSIAAIIACSGGGVRHKNSIGSLNKKKIVIKEAVVDDSLDKAMQAYRKFLEETPEDDVATPEAIRRLADLQLEAGAGSYDFIKDVQQAGKTNQDRAQAAKVKQDKIKPDQFGKSAVVSPILTGDSSSAETEGVIDESSDAFEERATRIADLSNNPQNAVVALPGNESVINANTDEAIELYKKLLKKYPLYDRNDQVMYQLARAYDDGGRQEEAKKVLDEFIVKYPHSIHYDEAQFRRGEIFFVNRKYRSAQRAYSEVVKQGQASAFFDQALFKRGWSLFKNSLYEQALDDYFRLLDIKTAAGYHIQTETNKTEYQRVEDTFRVTSLCFSYLGGADSIRKFLNSRGNREYDYLLYKYLAEHYFVKRRYQDSAGTYNLFLELNPLHEHAPSFHMRIIEIYKKGRFPKLVIEAKRQFAIEYALNGKYWTYHDISRFPGILAFMKTNLNDLAKHYHAVSQQARKRQDRKNAYKEAVRFYRSYLTSFPEDQQAPELNFLLAELLFDNKAFREAAEEYERTAYAYPVHAKSAESGYAAVLSYREYEVQSPKNLRAKIHLQTIRSSLQFAEVYPAHPQAAAVLTTTAESLYALKEYERAIAASRQMIENHPKARTALTTAAWVVIAHSSFELAQYDEAERSYHKVLEMLPRNDAKKSSITDKLAASIYKQGEVHQNAGELDQAVEDYLRIGKVARRSPIREIAEFDAANVLMTMEAWGRAAEVLRSFRKTFPTSSKQFDVTTKLALVYEKSDNSLLAAQEYEQIAHKSSDTALQKEALQKSAQLYAKAKDYPAAIKIYRRYIARFPDPIESALEARNELAQLYKKTDNSKAYNKVLEQIVKIDGSAGPQRSDRTKYLAASALFELTEPKLQAFNNAVLGEPFQKTLKNKKRLMQDAMDAYGKVADYQVAELVAATTYKIAGIYYEFSQDLLNSARPKNLNEEELMQYELLLEEQAYPFEEKAINVHEKNIELLAVGIFNKWIMKSLGQLALLVPVRYAKQEQEETFFATIN